MVVFCRSSMVQGNRPSALRPKSVALFMLSDFVDDDFEIPGGSLKGPISTTELAQPTTTAEKCCFTVPLEAADPFQHRPADGQSNAGGKASSNHAWMKIHVHWRNWSPVMDPSGTSPSLAAMSCISESTLPAD